MSLIFRKINLILLSFFMFFGVFAQTKDAQLWSEIAISKKINKKIKIELTESGKFKNNISQLSEIYTDLGVGYSFKKGFDLGVNYRFEQNKEKEDYFSSKHRFSVDASYVRKIGQFRIDFRTRFQSSINQTITKPKDELAENYARFRLKTSYKFLEFPINPSISAEFYMPVNGKSAYQFDKYRITLGGKYKVNKQHSVSLDYRIQSQIQVSNPDNFYILILGYSFSL